MNSLALCRWYLIWNLSLSLSSQSLSTLSSSSSLFTTLVRHKFGMQQMCCCCNLLCCRMMFCSCGSSGRHAVTVAEITRRYHVANESVTDTTLAACGELQHMMLLNTENKQNGRQSQTSKTFFKVFVSFQLRPIG